MSGTDREAFLKRVRAALGRGAGTEHAPRLETDAKIEELVRVVRPGGDLVPMFAANVVSVGMRAHPCEIRTFGETLRAVLGGVGARSVTVGMEDAALREQVERAIGGAGIGVIDWKSRPGLEGQYEVGAGITDVVAGIAETGTLVVRSGEGVSRGGFLVPPVHVAVVRASQLVPDMLDVWSRVAEKGGGMPASVVMITGPSKTADIEGILVTGVHGPREVRVVLIGDG